MFYIQFCEKIMVDVKFLCINGIKKVEKDCEDVVNVVVKWLEDVVKIVVNVVKLIWGKRCRCVIGFFFLNMFGVLNSLMNLKVMCGKQVNKKRG